jgi:hypothetical protein
MLAALISGGKKISREDAIALTAIVRAWGSCQERIRVHRSKPLPGPRRPAPEPVKPMKQTKPEDLPPAFAE